jgi:hypothetical protein
MVSWKDPGQTQMFLLGACYERGQPITVHDVSTGNSCWCFEVTSVLLEVIATAVRVLRLQLYCLRWLLPTRNIG